MGPPAPWVSRTRWSVGGDFRPQVAHKGTPLSNSHKKGGWHGPDVARAGSQRQGFFDWISDHEILQQEADCGSSAWKID
jgi:hypothetical protein